MSGSADREFALQNQLSGPHYGEFPPELLKKLPESGIMPWPMMFEERIGTEMALMLFDKTPFINQIAALEPFRLLLKHGVVATSHGPVMFLVFSVPDPNQPGVPFVLMESHLNPFNAQILMPWRDLARQSHWHLLIVNAKGEQVNLFEFENTFGLNEALAIAQNACRDMKHDDFALAKAELAQRYSMEDLYQMESNTIGDVAFFWL